MKKALFAAAFQGIMSISMAESSIYTASDTERTAWVNSVIPLPKEIKIERKMNVNKSNLNIIGIKDCGPIARQAESELHALLNQGDNNLAANTSEQMASIKLELLPSSSQEATRLLKVPNNTQAYIIQPDFKSGLKVMALNERGIYYGVQTLKCLLETSIHGEIVVLPLAQVIDWPDLEERGLWNSGINTPGFMEWQASLKLNFEHLWHCIDLNPSNTICPNLPIDFIDKAQAHAFHVMPMCAHFDFWTEGNNAKYFPADLKGKGDMALNPETKKANGIYHKDAICPCPSNPKLHDILTEWLLGAAKQGIMETSLWLTEYQPCYCQCDTCRKSGKRQLQLETEACVKAIEKARLSYPQLIGRIFITTPRNDLQYAKECLDSVPNVPWIKAECTYGRNDSFDSYAQTGRWLSIYCCSTAYGNVMRGAAMLDYTPGKMKEKLAAVISSGYKAAYVLSLIAGDGSCKGSIEKNLCKYLIAAQAEWSWNNSGRDLHLFNEAWATKMMYKNSEKAGRIIDELVVIEETLLQLMLDFNDISNTMKQQRVVQMNKYNGFDSGDVSENFIKNIEKLQRIYKEAAEINFQYLALEAKYDLACLSFFYNTYRLSIVLARNNKQDDEKTRSLKSDVQTSLNEIKKAIELKVSTWQDAPDNTKKLFINKTLNWWDEKSSMLNL